MSKLDDMLRENGIAVAHNFGGGTYAKEMRIPRGQYIKQHAHNYEHLSILASGDARVEMAGKTEYLSGPSCITIPAGYEHRVAAVTDVVWYCIHATNVADPEVIDASIMEGTEHASH